MESGGAELECTELLRLGPMYRIFRDSVRVCMLVLHVN